MSQKKLQKVGNHASKAYEPSISTALGILIITTPWSSVNMMQRD